MTVDLKWILILSMVLAVLGFLVGAGSNFTDLGLSPAGVKAVLAALGLLLGCGNAINSVLVAFGMTSASKISAVQGLPLAERASALASDTRVAAVVLKDQTVADSSGDKILGPKDVALK